MKQLYNEYMNMSNIFNKFKHDDTFSVDTLVNRYYEGGLDVARDYLYFKDDKYKFIKIKHPNIQRLNGFMNHQHHQNVLIN